MKRRYRHTNTADLDALLALYHAGHRVPAIARATGMTQSTVRLYVERLIPKNERHPAGQPPRALMVR